MKTRLRRLLTTGLLLAGLLLPAGLMSGCTGEATPTPGSGESTAALTATGTIQAHTVQLASEFGGRIEAITVAEGDPVTAGQPLVLLDGSAVAATLAEAEAQVSAAQAALDLLLASPRTGEVETARAALGAAQAECDGAYAQWQSAQAVAANPQDLRAELGQATTQVQLAGQGVEMAEAELDRVQLERGVVDASIDPARAEMLDYQVLAAQQALAAANADLATTQQYAAQLQTIVNYPLHLVLQANQAQGAYQLAEGAVGVAQAQLESVLAGPTAEEIAQAQATLALASAQADIYRAQLALYTLTSPLDGEVIDLAYHAGEVAAAGAPLLTLADTSLLTLTAYVPAPDLGRVVVQQPVTVRVDSFPDRTFTGIVRRINSSAEYTPRNTSTSDQRANLVFAVEIALPNPDGALRPGMPADVTFGQPQPDPALWAQLATPTPLPTATPLPSATPTATPSPTPSPTHTPPPCQLTTTTALNVRSGPGTEHTILGALRQGEGVTATGVQADGWWPVTFRGRDGWVAGEYVTMGDSCGAVEGAELAEVPARTVPVAAASTATSEPPPATSVLLPAAGAGACRVSLTANLNVRSGPGTAYPVLGTLRWPAAIPITGALADGSWLRVTFDDADGWIMGEYTSGGDGCELPLAAGETCRASITANLNLRAGPGTAYDLQRTLQWPLTVTVVGGLADGSWWQVEDAGDTGWIMAEYAALDGACLLGR
ncbi:MAG: SH3 domain-containing protein [Anaerolineae bacterium]|nr:SH3 domain-containing protein [Anaerolineae bacterium]